MKIRKGFVSNSSTTTFICEVCKNTYAAQDGNLEEAEMMECTEGHTFCQHHTTIGEDPSPNKKLEVLREALSDEDFNKVLKDDEGEISDETWHEEFDYEIRNELPPKYCPICSLRHVPDTTVMQFLLKEHSKKEETVRKEIQSRFKTYEEFKKYVKEG